MNSKRSPYLSFHEARNFVRKLGLQTLEEWSRYCTGKIEALEKKPENIPSSPEQVYRRSAWKNYKDWLKEEIMPFEEAKLFVKTLNLKHRKEWYKYCKGEYINLQPKPKNIPRDPDLRYRKYWLGWNDWLNSNEMREYGIVKEWMPFEEARDFVRGLKLNDTIEWKEYCKNKLLDKPQKPENIPTTPYMSYKNDGWIDFGDWLGTGRKRIGKYKTINDTWLSYEDAVIFVRKLGLNSYTEWKIYCKNEITALPIRPDNIPIAPNELYKNNGWTNWNDFLSDSNDLRRRVIKHLSFEDAKKFIHTLGLKNTQEWRDYKDGKLDRFEKIPYNIPKSPNTVYKDQWKGIRDWIGTE
jgi:exonuclease I